jgi:hypothetical protein
VAGAPDHHPQLLAELRTRIRETLAWRHTIRSKPSRPGVPQWTVLTDQLEGRVTFDPDEKDLCVVIDGEKVASRRSCSEATLLVPAYLLQRVTQMC